MKVTATRKRNTFTGQTYLCLQGCTGGSAILNGTPLGQTKAEAADYLAEINANRAAINEDVTRLYVEYLEPLELI